MRRSLQLEKGSYKRVKDGGDLLVPMAFSSELPYERWWGIEVLDHAEKSVRLGRLNDGAPVLFNHDWNDLRGVHEPGSIKIGKDRVLRGDIRLTAATQSGRDAIGLVESDVLTKGSIGYQIHTVIEQTTNKAGEKIERTIPGAAFERMVERCQEKSRGDLHEFRRQLDEIAGGSIERADDSTPVYRVVDWEPYENSLVTVPADNTVGVGRAKEPESQAAIVDEPPTPAKADTKGATEMPDGNQAGAGVATPPANDGAMIERLRIQTINGLCDQHKVDRDTREKWIAEGVTPEAAARLVLDLLAERGKSNPQASPAHLGMEPKQLQSYSLNRAINAVLMKNWGQAGLEHDAHKEIQKRTGKTLNENTFYVPLDVQKRQNQINLETYMRLMAAVGQRDLNVATGSAGGFLVDTQNQGFVDLLRNRSVVMSMGARRLSGLTGNITIPKQTAAATAYWLSSETTQITESQQTLGQIALTPKTVGGYTEVSRLLTLQSSPDGEQMVMSDIAKVIALAADLAAINGSGASGQPTGIIQTSGIGAVTGTSLAYAGVLEFQTDVAAANALTPTCGYVTTPAVAALLMARQRFSSTDTPLWDGNLLDARMAGFRAMSSNQIPTADMIFGDFQEVVIAEWGVLEVEVNPYANFQAGIVGIRGMYTMDLALRYAAAFSLATSIT